LRQNRL